MKIIIGFKFTLFTFAILAFLPNGFAGETPPENLVRVIYFVPNDRQPQPDIDATLDTLVKHVQQSYAEVMEKQGFGRKTFRLETDGTGKVVVHHIKGQFPDAYYHTEPFSKVFDETGTRFNLWGHTYLVALDVSTEPICGLGTFGRVLIPASGGCFNVAVAAHELGHSFGLVHDRRRDVRRTPSTYHADLMVTTFCAAEWLDVHPYFNPGEHISNQNTQIRTLETQNPAPAKSIRFRFQITDADGLHQAQVVLGARTALHGHLAACQRLNGHSDTYEFELVPTIHGIHTDLVLRVIDVHGNFTEKYFPIDSAPLLPLLAQVVSIPDANLATAIRMALNIAPGDAITQLNLLKLTDLSASNRQIADLAGLGHATQLQNLDLSGNQISNITPIENLTRLHVLNLSSNQIIDLTPIANLTNLQYLYLSVNQITDIAPVVFLINLERLYLSGNQINDITPIAKLKNLYHLLLSGNRITDITPIASLTNLRQLDLSSNSISDFSPIEGLTADITLVNNPGFPSGGPKMEGPWLWAIVPTGGRSGQGAATSGIDFLAHASDGAVTELEVATDGANEGQPVRDILWTTGNIATAVDNINTMANTIGLGS